MHNSFEIDLLVKKAYSLFSVYRFGHTVAVHHGVCCLSNEDIQSLKATPIKAIDRRLVYEYLDAEEENDAYAVAYQIKFLLPKILELLVQGEYIHHSIECILKKCHFHLASAWNNQEIDFMNDFALCFFKAKIMSFDLNTKVDDYLVMFHHGGLNIKPLLYEWFTLLNNPDALLNLLSVVYFNFENDTYTQYFADEKMCLIMHEWMEHLKTNDLFISALIETLATNPYYHQYQSMIETVFERL